MKFAAFAYTLFVAVSLAPILSAAPAFRLVVDGAAPGIAVAPTLHGLFFEDLNYAADGGLYAELVQNRSFEHLTPLYGWAEVVRGGAQGRIETVSDRPLNPANPTFLRVTIDRPGAGFGVANAGFDGISVRAGEVYLFAVHARSEKGSPPLSVALESPDGRELARAELPAPTGEWQRYKAAFKVSVTEANARLVVLAHASGRVDLDMVSLFPRNTFKQRRNGLRADIAQTLADLKPGFLRFPGGCIVEGTSIATSYRWKETVGDIAERRQNRSFWANRESPEYNQTCGLGFFEYFQLCEDIGAAAVPVINCGMTCQYNRGGNVPMDQLGPWVQDALDLVEFANGPASSIWGSVRAKMGHPEPFGMRYLAIGNEQWGQEYFDRYAIFQRELHRHHPEIQLISTAGPTAVGSDWEYAWSKFKSGTPADIVDEHYYTPLSWLFANVDRYASYDRAGPKVFVGEFAAHRRDKRSALDAALAEASYMTGLLRNADVVAMASYAPLLAKVGHTQWQPDLVWFDNQRVLLTPSYHVQALYSQNRPDRVLPTRIETAQPAPVATNGGRIGLGTWGTAAEFKDIVVTAADGQELYRSDFTQGSAGWGTPQGRWVVDAGVLRQADAVNSVAFTGDDSWRDYTLRLKARRLDGPEGFMVCFGAGAQGIGRWILGGWGNTLHGLALSDTELTSVNGQIEAGRWYDLRIELRGPAVTCYLDGQLIQQGTLKVPRRDPLYAVAGQDTRAGELVLFVTNPGEVPISADIDLRGAVVPAGEARLRVLTGEPNDVNTFDAPTVVVPRDGTVAVPGPAFAHIFPSHSLTVVRIKTGP